MEIAYRSLMLKYDLLRLSPEIVEKIPMLLKLQEEFRQWTTVWLRDRSSLPERGPLKHIAKVFIYGGRMLDWLRNLEKSGVEVNKVQMPLVFDVQLRFGGEERDVGRSVLVNLHLRELRIRKWGGGTLTLPLGEAVKWIQERVQEGAKLVLVAVWIGASKKSRAAKLYVALIFRREVVPMRAKRILVVDLNALHNGLVWAVAEGEKVIAKGIFRPDVSRIMRMQKVISKLDGICARKDKACNDAMAAKSKIWRLLRTWEDEVVKKLLRLAQQYRAGIVIDVPKGASIRMLREGRYNPKKKILLKFGRLRRKLQTLAEWYGIPLRMGRLYSSICPRCEVKMTTLPNRRVNCATCGFTAHRDEVPAYWASKLYSKFLFF